MIIHLTKIDIKKQNSRVDTRTENKILHLIVF